MSEEAKPQPPPFDITGKTPEEIERYWFENVYQGDKMRQATVRAVATGMLLGMLMACSNLYVGLKAGWSLGVAITACVMAFAIWQFLHKTFGIKEFSILENNAMQSAAAAAGSISAAGLSNAIPALWMLNPEAIPLDFWHKVLYLTPWIIVVTWLGVFLAVPTKRQLINVQQLPFPSGTAAAQTLKALHQKGKEATEKAKALGWAGILGAVTCWWRDADASWLNWYTKIPSDLSNWVTKHFPIGKWDGKPLTLSQVTLYFEGSWLFLATGAIMSFRQAWSMALGAVINYGFLAPRMLEQGVIAKPGFATIARWSLWTGVPMMVTSGLLLFFMNWRAVVRAFSTVGTIFKKRDATFDAMDKIEVPGSWFVSGFVVLGFAAVVLGIVIFHITWWMGIIAVTSTFFLVVVAGRATGETDITPVGPLSKITQLSFGAIKPGDVTVNLMTANITAGATTAAGDLLTDLKSGYLLGANPRQQFIAQMFGVVAGGLVAVPMFFVLIPTVDLLATDKWPAPASLTWKGVAELLSKGPESLPHTAQIGLAIGAALGIILPLLEMWLPRFKKYIPAATGLGLAFTINGFNSISMFLGALAALILAKKMPKLADKYVVPVSSGLIAGESLMGVLIAMLSKVVHVLD
jgi:OPT family oligopeptide transporter